MASLTLSTVLVKTAIVSKSSLLNMYQDGLSAQSWHLNTHTQTTLCWQLVYKYYIRSYQANAKASVKMTKEKHCQLPNGPKAPKRTVPKLKL